MDYTKLNDDIWCEIISYLNLKDIYNLENSDDLLERTRNDHNKDWSGMVRT